MAEEEEIRSEVDAVRAVYGDDCRVINEFPPHLTVHIKPRTADDSSQQFVEVTLGLKSDGEYPKKPPCAYIVDMKGLDDDRQSCLLTRINNKAQELSSCLMLVALCEEAVEVLSNMNHPEGNCPLCLCPLVIEGESGAAVSFMKLMSCFHCFHSECIIRFWKWLQQQKETNRMKHADGTTSLAVRNKRAQVSAGNVSQDEANCPVCRKLFHEKDMEHVLDYLNLSQLNASGVDVAEADIDEEEALLLQCDSENRRREKFEALLKLQQENNGLIEAMSYLAIQPGMFLTTNPARPSTSTEADNEQCEVAAASASVEVNSERSLNHATISKHRNPDSRRKKRFQGLKRPVQEQPCRKQWIKKEP